MKILVSGSSGVLGSALLPFLTAAGHSVTRLVRAEARVGAPEIWWDPAGGYLNPATVEGFDAVVHLAGENLAAHRWRSEFKARIKESRVKGTRLLAETLAKLSHPPQVLVSSSAIGYYGDRGDEVLLEESASGAGFLAEVCRDWEAATEPAAQKGIRVITLRTGFVLSASGGGLAKMLPAFRMGAGGVIGTGRQYMSWIAIDDLVAAILHAIVQDSVRGPVNAVAPNPVTNREFTKTLGRVLSRPTIFPVPAFAARLAFGEMADELLLSSQRVTPAKLLASGFTFQFPDLAPALRHLLGK